MIEPYTITGDPAVGGAGVATVTTTSKNVITGRVVAVGVVGRSTPPATTDITIRTANVNQSLPDVTLLTITNYTTDGWYQPFVLKDDAAGGGDIAANYVEPTIHDQVEVVVAQANSGDSVDVILLVDR